MVYALLACMYNMGSDMKKLHGNENLEAVYDDEGNLVREGVKEVWGKLEKYTLDYVMNLMRSKAYVDHTSEINSIYALIPIISFCYNHQAEAIPEPQLWRIIKWFYYSQIRARYVSQLPQKLDFDLRIIKEKEHPFEELLGVIAEDRRLKVVPEEFIGRTISHPFFALMKWYFKSKGATCFTTGLGLHKNMGEKYQLENDHIFPSAILKKHGYSRDNRIKYQMAQELTNRALLTQTANRKKSDNSAEEYLSNIKAMSPNSLQKQCIPEEENLWELENFEEFLDARRSILATEFNTFLDGLASEDNDSYGELTTEELIQQGESEELEFKQSLRWGSSKKAEIKKAQSIIMKTIAGFANSDGGTLIIGVTDSGEAVGLESDYESLNGDKDEFELHVGNLIDASFGKVFRANNIKMQFPVIHEFEICQIDIKSNKTAVVLESKNKNGQTVEKFYLRSGNQTAELSMAEASEYIESQFE
ncbi:MAG: RNA-binding domain-containing protein [Cocleimonas sp.]